MAAHACTIPTQWCVRVRHVGEGCSWLTAVRAALVSVSGYFAKTTLLAATAESRGRSWHCPRGMNWVRHHQTSCKRR